MTRRFLLSLLLTAAAVRIVCLFLFADTFYDTGRMISLYDLAANWAQTGHFWSDDSFVNQACIGLDNNTPRRNIDYKAFRAQITTPVIYNKNPHIADTWGYAALLGVVWKVTGDKSYRYLQVLQIVFDCAALAALAWILFTLFSSSIPAKAALYAYALFPPIALLTILPNREYYAAWGAVASLFFFIKGLKSTRAPWWWLAGGLALAAACWFRISILLLPAVYAVWLVLFTKPRSIIQAVLVTICMITPPLMLTVVPFAVHYQKRYNTYDFSLGIGAGSTLVGIAKFAPKYSHYNNDMAIMERARELGYPPDSAWWTPQFGAILKAETMRIIREDPLLYAETVVKRYVRYFFTRPPFPFTEYAQLSFSESDLSFFTFLQRHPLITIEKLVKVFCAIALPLLALYSLVRFKHHRPAILLLLGIWQYRILVFVAGDLQDRYVMECYFPVLLLAVMTALSFFPSHRTNSAEA